MKYYGGCDVGSTYTKAVILDENGKIVADTTIKSKINAEESARIAMKEVLDKVGLKSEKELEYLIGTGYGRNKVPFADENISEISCHAMGVHVTNPNVKAIIDIGGQDVKGIAIDLHEEQDEDRRHGHHLSGDKAHDGIHDGVDQQGRDALGVDDVTDPVEVDLQSTVNARQHILQHEVQREDEVVAPPEECPDDADIDVVHPGVSECHRQ